jgi:hypothetical protein
MTIKFAVIVRILCYVSGAVLSRIEPEYPTAGESENKRGEYSVQCCTLRPADTAPPPYWVSDTARTAYEHFLPP